MPKAETISTAKTPEDLDKAYASATKALAKLGLDMKTKKPDAAKIGPAMTKSKKSAEFKLSADANSAKLTVECEGLSNTLGILNVAAEREAEKRLTILKSLAEAGLISKAELADAQEEADKAKGPDPKVVANLERELANAQKALADSQKRKAGYEGLAGYDGAARFPAVLKELKEFGAKEHSEENFDFLEAVARNMAVPQVIANFIAPTAQQQVNLPSAVAAEAMAGDMTKAVAAIKALIGRDTMVRFKKEKISELGAVIAKAEKRIKELTDQKKKLGIK